MIIKDLQTQTGAKPDGEWGRLSRAALMVAFVNAEAAAITAGEWLVFADRLRVSVRQLAAVAAVESAGAGFDSQCRPKILFERHKFHKYTGGRFSVSDFSNPKGGGYEASSWAKLQAAIATGEVDAAFMACSWGKFQVLGEYWDDFGYSSPFALAISTVASEAAHYELLCHYIEHFALQDEMATISGNPETCRAFAKAYNGPHYVDFNYHVKLARAFSAQA